jgi:hypothetical protein
MFMISDGNMDPRELDLLEKVNVYDLIGLSRKQFAQVLTTTVTTFPTKRSRTAPFTCWIPTGSKPCWPK